MRNCLHHVKNAAPGRLRAGAWPVWLFALPPLGAILFCFILPYGSALAAGFGSGGSSAGPGLLPVLKNPALPGVLRFTLRQALLSMFLALGLGLPGAVLLGGGSGQGPGSVFIRSAAAVPFAMPPILVVLGFVLFFGNAGWANRILGGLRALILPGNFSGDEGPLRILYRPGAIILAHGFYNFPLVIRLVGDGLAGARRSYVPAAASLGASPLVSGLSILLPLTLPSIVAASLLVFLYSFTSFAVVLVLGGGPAATTLAVEIYRYARLSLDYQNAGALALVETLIAGCAFGAYVFFYRKSRSAFPRNSPVSEGYGGEGPGTRRGGRKGHPGLWGIFGLLYGLVFLFFVLGPILSIPAESLLWKPSRAALPRLTLRWWLSLGDRVLPALCRSLLTAVLSASMACILGILAAGAAKTAAGAGGKAGGGASAAAALIRLWAIAPLASSGIVLGLGFSVLYGREHSRSLPALLILHAVTALPFVFSSISEGLEGIPRNTLNAASSCGAGPVLRILTVDLPMSFRRIRSAWGFAAAISLGELNAVLMLGMEDWETLPLLIYRAAGSYRYGAACAAGSLLLLSCLGAFLLSETGMGRKPRRKPEPGGPDPVLAEEAHGA